jgi:hypothetical protein
MYQLEKLQASHYLINSKLTFFFHDSPCNSSSTPKGQVQWKLPEEQVKWRLSPFFPGAFLVCSRVPNNF